MKQMKVAMAFSILCALLTPAIGNTALSSVINNPDAFAWKLFVTLNHPADLSAGRGTPDTKKKPGDDGPVVWQTWMTTQEIFLDGGKTPPAWDAAKALSPAFISPVRNKLFRSPRKSDLVTPEATGFSLLRVGAPPPPDASESSMNRAAFEFVVTNELYYLEGQERFHATGRPINLPVEAQEIKSAWKLLSVTSIDQMSQADLDGLKKLYHTTVLEHEGKSFLYGLTALHITTKDLPNWLWTTFEHKDNPLPELRDNDRVGRPAELKGTKWENYRLRGTQTDFTDSAGEATLLANTQLEQGFQQTSSCITCHSRATVGDPIPATAGAPRAANRLPFFDFVNLIDRHTVTDTSDFSMLFGHVGSPNSKWFQPRRKSRDGTGGRGYTQLDFMWSLRTAKPRGE